ncbi:hypothetical protein BJ878DRAFT_479171 [Calycina marina]|uniref:Uncharacterized protein n=1 Tax=Calycina marina TaxID=1763456 RepID=A0A9P8CG60_9HELO|nr:hypothetical protein BJ878DRAFT_479171 [Calycina marina]
MSKIATFSAINAIDPAPSHTEGRGKPACDDTIAVPGSQIPSQLCEDQPERAMGSITLIGILRTCDVQELEVFNNNQGMICPIRCYTLVVVPKMGALEIDVTKQNNNAYTVLRKTMASKAGLLGDRFDEDVRAYIPSITVLTACQIDSAIDLEQLGPYEELLGESCDVENEFPSERCTTPLSTPADMDLKNSVEVDDILTSESRDREQHSASRRETPVPETDPEPLQGTDELRKDENGDEHTAALFHDNELSEPQAKPSASGGIELGEPPMADQLETFPPQTTITDASLKRDRPASGSGRVESPIKRPCIRKPEMHFVSENAERFLEFDSE